MYKYVNTYAFLTDADFSVSTITITVPAFSDEILEIPNFFKVIDDDINEIEQNFTVFAEIGSDVYDGFGCFQTYGDPNCRHSGTTEIRIIDNDCK